jgi:hypothetical protein
VSTVFAWASASSRPFFTLLASVTSAVADHMLEGETLLREGK